MPAATVCNTALNFVRDNLLGVQASPLQATWFAIGTSSQGTPLTATQLAAEAFRKVVTAVANGANPGEGLITCYLGPADSVGTAISEIGLFGGPTAGSGANTGTLLFYALYSHTHTNLESIQFTWDTTV
jgi:hypothetical protein